MLAAPASAAQTPPETGCPASNAVLVVADIAPIYGEEFLAMVDTNGNGLDADPGGVLTGSRAERLGILVAPLPGRVRERDEEVPAVQS
jgi:hypothetical protein